MTSLASGFPRDSNAPYGFVQTQDTQEIDLIHAQEVARTGKPLYFDRSRHASTTETHIWVFADEAHKQQIGSITRVKSSGWHQWKANRISVRRGMPVSEVCYTHIADAVFHIASYEFTP